MTTLRNALRAAAIIVALGASAAIASAQARIELTSPAAIVNGEVITKAQIEAVVRHFSVTEGQPNSTTLTPNQALSRRHMAVAVLVDDAIWRQAIAKQVAAPSQAEVTKKMVAFEDDLKKQSRTMQQFCEETAQTLAQVQTSMGFFLQWNALVEAQSTDEALRAHYEQYKDFYEDTKVDVSHIAVRVAPDANDSDRRAAQNKIMNARNDILNGTTTFEKAAESISQCDTKTKGGRIGFIPRRWGWFDEAFTRAAFDPSLKPGDITGPVLTQFGYELIRLNNRQPGNPTTFESVREQVKNDFREDLRQRIIADYRKHSQVDIYRNVVEAVP